MSVNTISSVIHSLAPYVGWIFYAITFYIAASLALSSWIFWREELYKHSKKLLPWVFLEIRIPRETLQGPKAMEQFLAALYPLRNKPGTWIKKWWDGEVPRWHTVDIIGKNNEVKFFMRVSGRLSAAIEGLLYAQYPNIEIAEVEDPLAAELPRTYQELEAQGYEIFGNELYQTHGHIVSIRTYSEFEEERGDEKGRIIDPFSVSLEIIANLKPAEMIFVQLVLMPDVNQSHWKHEADHILDKLRNTTQKTGVDKEGKPQFRFRQRTPGEEGVIKRIEDKKERSTYETTIRYMYIAPKELYNMHIGYRGIQTFFNQFRHDRQTLERNIWAMTKTEWYYFPFFFPAYRLRQKRIIFYNEFIHRFLPEESFAGQLANASIWHWCFFHKPALLSTEEVATLFHIPTNVVLTQSTMDRIESKRLAAPVNLPE